MDTLDQRDLQHLANWARHYSRDEEEAEQVKARILRYLDTLDLEERAEALSRGWPTVHRQAFQV